MRRSTVAVTSAAADEDDDDEEVDEDNADAEAEADDVATTATASSSTMMLSTATPDGGLPCNPAIKQQETMTYHLRGAQHFVLAYAGTGPVYSPVPTP